LGDSGPKPRLNVTLSVKLPLEFQLHLILMAVDLGRCSLLPTAREKRSAQALQAKIRKCLLILACHGHLLLKVEAAFHNKSLNLTKTVAVTQCFTFSVMLMKGIYYRCGYRGLSPLASLDIVFRLAADLRRSHQRSFLPCLVIHIFPGAEDTPCSCQQAGWGPSCVHYSSPLPKP